jgi:hypothetical protein
MNKEQMNGYYRQATKMANILYEHMVDTFENTPCVVYCVGTERWYNHVTVEVWVCIGNGFAPDDVREAVGSVSMSFTFASWRHEKTSDFIQQVKDETNAFLRKVIMQGLTGQEQ